MPSFIHSFIIITISVGLDNGVEAYLRIYAYTSISVYVRFVRLYAISCTYILRILRIWPGGTVGVLAVLCAFGSVDLWLSHG